MSPHFFILPQSATQILSLAGHDFLLHLVAATSSSISGSTCGRAYRVCLRPFREVRLQRDNYEITYVLLGDLGPHKIPDQNSKR